MPAPLDPDDLTKAVRCLRNGEKAYADKIIKTHLRLAMRLSVQYAKKAPFLRDEFLSYALLALVESVDKFPSSARDNNITPYIHTRIKWALTEAATPETGLKVSKRTVRDQKLNIEISDFALTEFEYYHTFKLDTFEIFQQACLTELDWYILMLRYAECTYQEIATKAGLGIKTVERSLQNIFERIRQLWLAN